MYDRLMGAVRLVQWYLCLLRSWTRVSWIKIGRMGIGPMSDDWKAAKLKRNNFGATGSTLQRMEESVITVSYHAPSSSLA